MTGETANPVFGSSVESLETKEKGERVGLWSTVAEDEAFGGPGTREHRGTDDDPGTKAVTSGPGPCRRWEGVLVGLTWRGLGVVSVEEGRKPKDFTNPI